MDEFTVRQAEFVTSAAQGQGYPSPLGCEIAIVGKSNVGKSSLINAVCHNGKLAKTSATPGKTRLINFFRINREFLLVDLPGYGYAKASKTEQAAWGELIETYLASGRLDHILLLLDIRHEPTQADRQMFQYVVYYNIPYTLIATKADKLPRSKRQQAANQAAKALGAPPYAIPFSAEEPELCLKAVARMGQIVSDIRSIRQGREDAAEALKKEAGIQ